MTSANSVVDHPAAEIARLAFSMFLYVADKERNISVQEVRRFQNLMKELEWVRNTDLRSGLSDLKENYSSLWEDYEDGVLTVDFASVSATLDHVCQSLGAERGGRLRRDLQQFLQRLDRGPYSAKLLQSDHRVRAQARNELTDLLRSEETSLADPDGGAPADPPGGRPAAGQPSPIPEDAAMKRVGAVMPEAGTARVDRPLPDWHASEWSPSGTPVWTPGKTKVRCVEVVRETHDTKTYCFVADPVTLFHFKPGQFVTIEVPVESTTLRRSYTISSSPSRPYVLSITVKKVPMGWLSNWLFDNVEEGFECMIAGPAGKFTCFDHPAEKMLLLTAGSGVTPAISMLRWLSDTSSKSDVVFINNVRSPDDIIFHHEILHLGAKMGSKAQVLIVPSSVPAGRHWHGPTGRLNEALLRLCAPDFTEREAFVCGPAAYMEAAQELLLSLGHPSNRYHDESFGPAGAQSKKSTQSGAASGGSNSVGGFPSVKPRADGGAGRAPSPGRDVSPPLDPSGFLLTKSASRPQEDGSRKETRRAASSTKITIKGSGQSFAAGPGQTILEAAEAAGVSIENSCRNGVCGSCKMRKVSGDVKFDELPVLSQEDIGPDHILTCIAKPLNDIMLAE